MAKPQAAGERDNRADDWLLPLEVRGLTYRAGGRRLVDGLDLHLDTLGVTAVMGPNGAGKSVLLRLLHGLLVPDSGQIHWNGRPMGQTVRKRQALVFQRAILLRRTVRANLEFALKLKRGRHAQDADTLLRRVGLETKASSPARRLSGGEQQRLALARALALAPDVLFLDEPTASLDPASVAAIEDIVLEARTAGVKLIMVTHDQGQARRLADDVVFLNQGRVVEHTEVGRFFEHPESPAACDYLAGRLVL